MALFILGSTPDNELYGRAPRERVPFLGFRYKKVRARAEHAKVRFVPEMCQKEKPSRIYIWAVPQAAQ